jgi:hypothetical protein
LPRIALSGTLLPNLAVEQTGARVARPRLLTAGVIRTEK